MILRLCGSRLVASDEAGVTLYEIGSGEEVPRVLARIEAAVATRADGLARVSEVRSGRFARLSCEKPGEPIRATIYDMDLEVRARQELSAALDVSEVALSPDGLWLGAMIFGGGPVGIALQSGETRWEMETDIGGGLSWSNDGAWIAAGESGQGGGSIYLLAVKGDAITRYDLVRPRPSAPFYDAYYASCFTPDDRRVLFANSSWGQLGLIAYDVGTRAICWSQVIEEASEEDEEEWVRPELALAAGGRVALLSYPGRPLLAFAVEDGAPLDVAALDGAMRQSFSVAPDDAQRRLWWWDEAQGVPRASPYPDTW